MATLNLDGWREGQSFIAKYMPKIGTSQMIPNIAFPHTSGLTSGLGQCRSSPVKRASVTTVAVNDGTSTIRVAEKAFEFAALVESIALATFT